MRGAFTPEQVKTLLNPIKPNRVLSVQGHAHVSQQDITAHLIRMFGFGNFDIEVLSADLVFETQRTDAKTGAPVVGKWDVCYRAMVRLTIRNPEGEHVATYENGSTATGQNQSRGDGHDLAYKSAISLSIKRAAIALGDQFGLSLYNKGQLAPLVIATIVGAQPPAGDVQDQVPQQVSLGNDETEKLETEPKVKGAGESVDVAGIFAQIEAASTLEELQNVWEGMPAGAKGFPQIKAAVNARKRGMGDPDPWAATPIAEVKP